MTSDPLSTEKKSKRCWYEIFYQECPGCGRESEFRERHYTPKPKDRDKRVHYKQSWCGGCY